MIDKLPPALREALEDLPVPRALQCRAMAAALRWALGGEVWYDRPSPPAMKDAIAALEREEGIS